MRVFSDKHHSGLFESLRILFVDRLGHELYRPIGVEWFNEGYWMLAKPYGAKPGELDAEGKVHGTVRQFLDIDQQDIRDGRRFNDGARETEEGVYTCEAVNHKTLHKAVTFEAFKNIKFDVIIASIPDHIKPYKELIRKYQPQAKLIFQIGNAWSVAAGTVPNVMASAMVRNVPPDINFVSYHQEFSLDTFRKGEPHQNKNVYSFIHNLKAYPDWQLFKDLEKALPEYNFRSFGADCRDGGIHGPFAVADKMREAQWIVHFKWGGDGYGHVVFNSFAVGRPMIIKAGYYRGKMLEPLLVNGETCLFVDGLSAEEVALMVREFSESKRYMEMANRCREKFDEVVDFEQEAKDIEKFISNLK